MYFNKYLHAANFEFVSALTETRKFPGSHGPHPVTFEGLGNNVFRFTVGGGEWDCNESRWEQYPDGVPSDRGSQIEGQLESDPFRLVFRDRSDQIRLQTTPGKAFGVCGEQFMMSFELVGSESFYGMGEKFLGLELSNTQTKFWNTDVVADFAHSVYTEGRPDPAYVSIPYVILRTCSGWVGILVNNPGSVQINTGAVIEVEGFMAVSDGPKRLLIGAEHGQPDVFFLFADSLPELTRSYQQLVGVTPLPPVWALGYHQCRWGYTSATELLGYKARFAELGIPVDGLWLDIDYMRGYRVFTFDETHFPELEADLAAVQSDGPRVVPIIDPGVKVDPEWDIYRDGLEADVYCKNYQGKTFVGQVWPGDTAFVDYTRQSGWDWWANKFADCARKGLHGCWNDMNDPATGFVENSGMLWDHRNKPHWTAHNQFAKLMAEATRAGFLQAHPDERPFILSRSGSTGMARVAAIWHGDSTSNRHWLELAIPTALNLSLSGVPFNGPDLGGFMGDTTPQLFLDYLKACFLFPFCRNHTAIHTARQEPWSFPDALPVIRDYIRDRYRLRPYLYQLFVQHEEQGEAILRPLFYDFDQPEYLRVEDQFMVGPAILQAPLLREERERQVQLPPGRWWDFKSSQWVEGGQELYVHPTESQTPMYARAGTAVPMEVSAPDTHHWHGKQFDLHLFLEPNSQQTLDGELVTDDGCSFDYQNGKRTRMAYTASVEGDALRINTRVVADGFGPVECRFVLYGQFNTVFLNESELTPVEHVYRIVGSEQSVFRV